MGETLLREWFAFGDMRKLDEGLKVQDWFDDRSID